VMDDRMRSAIHVAGHVIGAVKGGMGLTIVSVDPHTIRRHGQLEPIYELAFWLQVVLPR